MKKLFFAIVLVLCSYSAFSQQQVILQRGNTLVKQFSDFTQAVIDSAQNDDVIYLASGMYTGNVNINKRIVLIGVGHYPNSSPSAPGYTAIGSVLNFKKGSSGSIMTGIRSNGQIQFGSGTADTVSGILIERCKINSIHLGRGDNASSSHILRNNIIDNLSGNMGYGDISVKSSSINNNIIRQASRFNLSNTFSNNIFTGLRYSGGYILYQVELCLFQNNVFYSAYYNNNPYLITSSNNIFTNNMFVGYTPSVSEGNVFENNFNNVDKDSVFENYSYLLSYEVPYFVFDYAYNYHLKTGCVGKNAGNDGTDIGIYGGLHVWKDGGLPGNPHVSVFNVSPAVPASGIINVNATVEGQNR